MILVCLPVCLLLALVACFENADSAEILRPDGDNIDINCVLSHDIDIYDVITMWMFDINNNEWKNHKK